MSRNTTCRLLRILGLVLATGLFAGAGQAEEALDPLAALPALAADDLANLSGRQGISVSDQDLAAIANGGSFEAGGGIETGIVHFGSSMQKMSGLNNQAINTGNNANVLAGMTVHIHLH